MSCATPILPSGPLGHVAEIAGHHPETAGHVRPKYAVRTGNRSIWLIVNPQNAKAISFYRSRGMTQDGIAYFELGGIKHENMVMVARI
jgi:ribosomal protein S18 acetylase RimI-like enzyme